MKLVNQYSITALTIAITACGGGGSGSSSGGGESSETGVFTDSPVSGAYYETETHQGFTNSLGEYSYEPGETVVFSVGGIAFPAVAASGQVTPRDLAPDNDDEFSNILQFLQTLDSDGNASNGISISRDDHTLFEGSAIQTSSITFDDDVQSVLDTSGDSRTVVSEEQAKSHFDEAQASSLLGSWVYSEGSNKRNVLSFVHDNRYIIIHEHGDGDEQVAGSAEYGSYQWNHETDEFSVNALGETDGSGGLYDGSSSFSEARLNGDELILGGTEEGDVTFIRVKNIENSRTGSWVADGDTSDEFHVLTFLSNSEYVIAHSNEQEMASFPQSGEFGTYSSSKGAEASVETDGIGGISGDVGDITATRWGDLLIEGAGAQDEDGSVARLGQFTATLSANYGSNKPNNLGTILALRQGRFTPEGVLGAWTLEYTSSAIVEAGECGINMELNLNENGSGSVTFPPNECNDFADDDTNAINWEVRESGSLSFIEGDDSGDSYIWDLVRVSGSQDNVLVSVSTPDGQDDAGNEFTEARLYRSE